MSDHKILIEEARSFLDDAREWCALCSCGWEMGGFTSLQRALDSVYNHEAEALEGYDDGHDYEAEMAAGQAADDEEKWRRA